MAKWTPRGRAGFWASLLLVGGMVEIVATTGDARYVGAAMIVISLLMFAWSNTLRD